MTKELDPALLAFGLALGGAGLESAARGSGVTLELAARCAAAVALLGAVATRFVRRRRIPVGPTHE